MILKIYFILFGAKYDLGIFALEMLFKFLYYFVFLMCFIIWVRSCGHFPCIWKLLQFFLSSCCCRGREILTTWLANIYFFSGMLILNSYCRLLLPYQIFGFFPFPKCYFTLCMSWYAVHTGRYTFWTGFTATSLSHTMFIGFVWWLSLLLLLYSFSVYYAYIVCFHCCVNSFR